jgi:hypothetical protein
MGWIGWWRAGSLKVTLFCWREILAVVKPSCPLSLSVMVRLSYGEKGVYTTFEENAGTLKRDMLKFGFDLEKLER